MGFFRDAAVYLGFTEPVLAPAPTQVAKVRAEDVTVPPSRPSVTSVTVSTALGIGAVYRAISILVAAVSQMELAVYRNGVEIPTPALVKQPNVNDTQKGFIEETVFSLAGYGNAYWWIVRPSGATTVSSVQVLDPTLVSVRLDDEGAPVYSYNGREYRSDRIKHLKLMRRPGQAEGYGPIQAASGELQAALRLRAFADEWFDISGIPTGVLSTDMVLGPEESAAFAQAWKDFITQHGGTAVLSQGLQYEPIRLKPAEAQFLDVQNAVITNIARLFGVPAMHLIAELRGTSNTYLNLEQANIVFLQTTLTRYMTEIEDALSSLLPRGQQVQFLEEGLLRMDTTTKWNVRKTQVEIGYTTGNELRAAEGKAPLRLPKPPAPAPEEDASGDA